MTSDTDNRDILSDSHREFMISYCAFEERKAKAAVERFLARKLRSCGASYIDVS
jgi:hypothetical protein